MDLSMPIIALLGVVGYSLNKSGKTPRQKESIRQKIMTNETPSGTNIYNSVYDKQIHKKEQEIGADRYKKMLDPEKTNIIPPVYNTTCNYDCDNPEGIGQASVPARVRGGSILPSVDIVDKKVENARRNLYTKGPMFAPIKVQGKALNVEDNTSGGVVPFLKEGFSALTGTPMEMKHNNMVPFFGGTIKQNMKMDSNEGLLGRYTGVDNTYIAKKEANFIPTLQKQEVYGRRNDSDVVSRDRVYQSSSKANLLPFPQLRVGPLPEADVRPAFKTLEELMVNPPQTYAGRIVPGLGESRRGIVGKVSKNKVQRTWDLGIERTFPGGSHAQAPMARDNFTNGNKRIISEAQFGFTPAYNSSEAKHPFEFVRELDVGKRISDYPITIVTEDTKQTFNNDWVRNPAMDLKSNEIERPGYFAREQERQTTNHDVLLPAIDLTKGEYQHYVDNPRATIKEGNLFSYTGTATHEVNAPRNYSAEYNYTKERQYINNPDYNGPAAMSSAGVHRTENYENLDIFTAREQVTDLKDYIHKHGSAGKLSAGPESENIYERDDRLRMAKYDYGANVNRVLGQTSGAEDFGKVEMDTNKEVTEKNYSRLDCSLLDQVRENPYHKDLVACSYEKCGDNPKLKDINNISNMYDYNL
jgi:hypothetical protein